MDTPFSIDPFDVSDISDTLDTLQNFFHTNPIVYESERLLSDESYYLDCLNFLFKNNIDYEYEINFDSIRLIHNIYSLYPELLNDNVLTVENELYLFRIKLNKFFDFVRDEKKNIQIDTIIEMGCFLGGMCPYDDCDNFIFGERECCNLCKREIRIETIFSGGEEIDYSCNYYLEGMLYYNKI